MVLFFILMLTMQCSRRRSGNKFNTHQTIVARNAYSEDYKRQKRRIRESPVKMYLESTDSPCLNSQVRLLYSRLAARASIDRVKNNCKIEIEGYIGIEIRIVYAFIFLSIIATLLMSCFLYSIYFFFLFFFSFLYLLLVLFLFFFYFFVALVAVVAGKQLVKLTPPHPWRVCKY